MNLKSHLIAGFIGLTAIAAKAGDCNINLAVLPMTQGENVPQATEDYLLTRLTQLVTADGVTADPYQGQFFISAKFNHITEDVTPGPPAQNVLHSYLTLYIGDLASETVYSTTTIELRGVGTSTQRAFINAMRTLNAKNSKVNEFVEKGTKKIVEYFDKNYPSILNKARRAAEKHSYDEALWHLVSIPECCKGFNEAFALEKQYFQAYIDQVGAQLYAAAVAAWSAGQDREAAEQAFKFLVQIDPESSAYGKAVALAAEMKASVKDDRMFELRQKYNDAVDLERRKLDAIREVGVAYGKGQQPTTTNLMWLR